LKKPILLLVTFLVFCLTFTFSYSHQEEENELELPDLQDIDSLFDDDTEESGESIVSDSTLSKQKDTIKITPLYRHGALGLISSTHSKSITKQEIRMQNYFTLGEIIQNNTGYWQQHSGMIAYYNAFNVFGARANSNQFRFNGRPVFDISNFAFSLDNYSPESFERIELFTGSDAVIFGDNSSGMLINMQEIRYNTGKPYTKIWLAESGLDFIAADGVYSVNPAKEWNLYFGFKNMSERGGFENTWHSSWNLRAGLRWNPNDRTSISLTEVFTNHGNGMSGGSDLSRSAQPFDELLAVPIYSNSNERNFRHDLTLNFSHIQQDSIYTISASTFVSHSDWDRLLDSRLILDTLTPSRDKHIQLYYGANGSIEFRPIKQITMIAGVESIILDAEKSMFSQEYLGLTTAIYGRAKIDLGTKFNASGGFRLSNYFGETGLSFGGRLNYIKSESTSIFADISTAPRFATPAEGLDLSTERHSLLLLGYQHNEKLRSYSFTLFARNISEAIVSYPFFENGVPIFLTYNNAGDYSAIGARANYNGMIFENVFSNQDALSATINIAYNNTSLNNQDIKLFPIFELNAGLSYRIRVNRSLLDAGFRAGVIGEFIGETLFPYNRTHYTGQALSSTSFTGVDIFAKLRLGQTYLRLHFINFLNNGYNFMPVYPAFRSNLRLSVSSSFFN